jgi:hypothetical protein
MLARALDRIRAFPSLVAAYLRAARRFNVSSIAVWKRAIVLYWRYGLSPDETLGTGLVDPKNSPEDDAGSIGKRRLTRHLRRFNPQQWECLVEDKAVFNPYCAAFGLPVPKLYAVLDKNGGWTGTGRLVNGRAEWEVFFNNDLPQEFIIKPALGVYGRGVDLYQRSGTFFESWSGQNFSAAALYERLQNDPNHTRFVFQERVFNHPDIQRLTGTQSLQTVRFRTWISSEGQIEFYDVLFKLILGRNVSDNYDSGRTGNVIVVVDPQTGTLGAPLAASPDGIGFNMLPIHPVTGVDLSGTVLPYWAPARQLVERAARLFLPLRTIGWDVALTGTGPILIEGNAWWDPVNHCHHPKLSQIERARFMSRLTSEP